MNGTHDFTRDRRVLMRIVLGFAGLCGLSAVIGNLPRSEVRIRSELPGVTIEDVRLMDGERQLGRGARVPLGPGDRAHIGLGVLATTRDAHLEFDIVAHGRRIHLRSTEGLDVRRGETAVVVLDRDFSVINRAVGPGHAG